MVRHLEALILGTVDDMAGYPIVMARTNADLQVVNTVTETAVLEYTVPANFLSGDHGFRVTLNGFLKNDRGGNTTYTIRIKLGATTLWRNSRTIADAGTVVNAPIGIRFEVMAKDSDAEQEMFGTIILTGQNTAPTTGEGEFSETVLAEIYGTSTEDGTIDNDLVVTIEMSNASASAEFTRRRFLIEYL